MGHRYLIEIVKDCFPNPYNEDMFVFMSMSKHKNDNGYCYEAIGKKKRQG